MKILKSTEQRHYAYLADFVMEHELEGLFFDVFDVTLISYEGSQLEAIETLLPYTESTDDTFTVVQADKGFLVIRLKTDKEIYGYSIVDVHSRVADMNETIEENGGIPININDDEAVKVLDIVDKYADCNNGVDWDDIDNAIVKYLQGRVYYQPEIKESDDINSFEVYRNPENARKDFPDREIKQYNGDDIEGYVFRD
jgi:hypothetical protein